MEMIKQQKSRYSIGQLCRFFGVSQSRYYRRRNENWQRKREQRDAGLKADIHRIWQRSRGIYGSPRIEQALRKEGIFTSRKRVAGLMKAMAVVGCYNRRKKPQTTDSKHSCGVSKNLLKQRAFPTHLREVVVTDTTYVWSDQGWHYLATVMDLRNREILGWSFGPNNDRHLISEALWKASHHLNKDTKAIHHSDRGSTYCSKEYRKLIQLLGMESSMSAKGYCYDNAHMESFFGSLKCECKALEQSLSPAQIKLELFDYIEGFYNTNRIHSALNSMSPMEFAINSESANSRRKA